MPTKTYNQTGEEMDKDLKASWSSQKDRETVSQKPANDFRDETVLRNLITNRFSQGAASKLLMRKRRRSRHPLRDLRLKRGFTLEALANLTELSPSYLSRLESGTRRLNADILQKLAETLSCHPGELLQNDAHVRAFNPSMVHFSESEPSYEQSQGFSGPRLNAPDLPLYHLQSLSDKACTLELDSPSEWVHRPHQLVGIPGAISFQVPSASLFARYQPGNYIFAHPTRPLSQGCSVLLVTHDNRAYIGELVGWSSHNDHNNCITLRVQKARDAAHPGHPEDLVNIDNTSIKVTYRIIGLIEAA